MRIEGFSNFPPIYVRLFHSRRKLQRKLDKAGLRHELKASKALTVTIEREGEASFAVLMEHDDGSPQTLALLVHEAVHVSQGYWRSLGEDDPSDEFMAYTVQQVAQYLMEEHEAWRSRRGLE